MGSDDVLLFGRSVSEEDLGPFQSSRFTAAELDAVRERSLRG